MSELNKKINPILNELEGKIETENDKQLCIEAFSKIFNLIEKEMDDKIDNIEQKQKEMEFKLNRVDEVINKMEEELFLDDEDDYIELSCPYCNNVIELEMNEIRNEVICPECNNIIELDWNYEDNDEEHGHSCHGGCSHCHDCEDDENNNYDNEDDDM